MRYGVAVGSIDDSSAGYAVVSFLLRHSASPYNCCHSGCFSHLLFQLDVDGNRVDHTVVLQLCLFWFVLLCPR